MRSLLLVACLGFGACGEVKDQNSDAPPPPGDGAANDMPVDDGPGDGSSNPTPKLWLKMDDPSGDGALDSAGTHVTNCQAPACPPQIAGKIGGAYQFAGHRLTVAPATDLAPGTGYTLALWVRVDQLPDPQLGNAIIAAKNLNDLDASYALSVNVNLVPQFYSSSEANQNLDGNSQLELGAFHHLAATWDGTVKILYVDGVKAGSGAASSMPNNNNLGMTIGQRQSTAMPLTFTGTIDELQVFDRALSQAEISAIMSP